jgi:ribonuclease D
MGDTFIWIDRPDQLQTMLTQLQPGRMAIDTEADSLHHYRESLCLVQISQGASHYLVDPLAPFDLAPLWQRLAGQTWLLHGADYDLRMLRRAGGPEPVAVFDTMLAGQLLGFSAFGYAALVERFFEQKLCKKNQKADWSRRPLPKAMLHYAVQDTFFLDGLAQRLADLLDEQKRLEWHAQSCARVLAASRISHAEAEEETEAWRVSGANALHPGSLAILKAVWEWREKEAEAADVPVFKIMPNEALLRLAEWADAHRRLPPPAWPHWPHRITERRIDSLIAAIHAGRSAEPIPRLPRRHRPAHDPKSEQRLDRIKAYRDHLARELHIDPSLIAPKSILAAIARDTQQAPQKLIDELRWCPWQYEILRPALDATP